MTSPEFSIDEELLRDRLRALAPPTPAVAQWDDVCQRVPVPWRTAWRTRSRPLVLALAVLVVLGTAAAIAEGPLPRLPWQGDAAPGFHAGEVQALTDMAVFQTPRTPEDVLPADAASAFREFTRNRPEIPDGLLPGVALLSQSRLLLSDAGPRQSRLYVAPTTKGQVCELVMPEGGGGCVGGFARTSHAIDLLRADDLLVGLVPDDVATIAAVTTDGTSTPVTVQRNAFAIAPPELDSLARFQLIYADGSSSSVDLQGRALAP